MVAPIIVGTVCATVYGLFELFARRRERIAFIEKLSEIQGQGQFEGKINLTFGKSFSAWALRGGCLLAGMGLGIIIGYLLTFGLTDAQYARRIEDAVYGGCVLLGGGLGLIAAFMLEMKYLKKKEE